MKTINYEPMSFSSFMAFFCLIIFLSCGKNEETPLPSHDLSFDFEDGMQGWTAGMSDFPSDWDPEGLEFSAEHAPLPTEANTNGMAVKISGRNLSDDLFMFMKREVTGLKPNHTYSMFFEITLASQYPSESYGIGGSPGSSVYLKAGGAAIEPQVIEEDQMFQMNIDKGNQSQGGSNMVVLGTVGIPGEEFRYTLITRDNHDNPLKLTTDAKGSLWIIFGTDSGFEGTSTLYYDTVSIRFQE